MSTGTQVKPNQKGLATGCVAVCLGLVFLPMQGVGANTPSHMTSFNLWRQDDYLLSTAGNGVGLTDTGQNAHTSPGRCQQTQRQE